MSTGKDIAKFVSMVTGDDKYEEMYDHATEKQNMLKTEATNKFKEMLDRMNVADKKKIKDFVD